MEKLNLPSYPLRIKNNEKHYLIFGEVRKKYIVLTPEEWVRQHFIHYLLKEKSYPISLIAVEKQFTINNLKKRSDILVFGTDGTPDIIVECKAPHIKITQETFDQIARYNLHLNAKYLIVTNGLDHYYCQLDPENETYIFLQDIPSYKI
jgi:hypothetical protein